jgi:hypothetical protein
MDNLIMVYGKKLFKKNVSSQIFHNLDQLQFKIILIW